MLDELVANKLAILVNQPVVFLEALVEVLDEVHCWCRTSTSKHNSKATAADQPFSWRGIWDLLCSIIPKWNEGISKATTT